MKCNLDNLSKLLDQRAEVNVKGPPDFTVATIMSVGDLVRIVECFHTGEYQYRGQRDVTWKLLPSLTRPGGPCDQGLGPSETWQDKERAILEEFSTYASQHLCVRWLSQLELAVLAQHHLAPTRLLDWTMNPLAALYFAVEQDKVEENHDSVVWAVYGHRDRMKPGYFSDLDPSVHFVIPDHTIARAAVQASLFAFWGDATKPMDEALADRSALWKIIVPNDRRSGIKWALHCLGINRYTLFPDLDGLASYLSWKHGQIHQEAFQKGHIPIGSM